MWWENMAKARDTATDRLSNIIEVVELGRRTGLLSAERGAGQTREEGDIYFVGGRALYAALMQLRGREALIALGQWGPCTFSFDPQARAPTPNIAEAITGPHGAAPAAPGYRPAQGSKNARWPTPTGPVSPMPAPTTPSPTGAPARASASGPLGRRPRRSPDLRDLMTVVTTHHLSRVQRTILLLADGAHDV